MGYLPKYRLPKIPPPSVHKIGDGEIYTQVGYDEVIYNYNTMTYETLSQRNEIQRLNNEIAEKELKKKQDLKSIIGYYYKRN